MGSFYTSCALTHEIIDGRTDVVMLMLTKRPYETRMPNSSWSIYTPVPILFEGRYDTYGRLENLKLFQSKEVLSDDARKAVEDLLFTNMQKFLVTEKNPLYDYPSATNLEKLIMDRDVFFKQKDYDNSNLMFQTVLDMSKIDVKPEAKEGLDDTIQTYLDSFGFSNIEEMEKHVKENEEKFKMIPVSFMMFRKDAFMKLLSEYGMEDGIYNKVAPTDSMLNDNYDHNEKHAVKIQRQRYQDLRQHQSEELNEILQFVNDFGSYAGANRPEYTFDEVIKTNEKGQVIEDLILLKKMHGLDISLLNDYLNLLGIIYQPTMTLSESVRNFGFAEAFQMQQSLLESVNPKKTVTP